jgi:hypothetical protein
MDAGRCPRPRSKAVFHGSNSGATIGCWRSSGHCSSDHLGDGLTLGIDVRRAGDRPRRRDERRASERAARQGRS